MAWQPMYLANLMTALWENGAALDLAEVNPTTQTSLGLLMATIALAAN